MNDPIKLPPFEVSKPTLGTYDPNKQPKQKAEEQNKSED